MGSFDRIYFFKYFKKKNLSFRSNKLEKLNKLLFIIATKHYSTAFIKHFFKNKLACKF